MKYTASHDDSLFNIAIELFPDSSRSAIRSWIAHRRFLVNNQIAQATTPITKGSTIELKQKPLPQEGPIRIRYEDQHIIVIEKPSGILSVALDTKPSLSAHSWVKQRHPGKKVFVVHRLDKETSGLMMFAFSQEAFSLLKEALKQRHIERIYEAIVEGHINENGTWDTYLIEDRTLMMHVCSAEQPEAERAITHYTVLETSINFTRIECRLETGKKNQIRVQAQNAGHPIVGDTKYGSLFVVPRVCLHAKKLSFIHPVSQQPMTFTTAVSPLFNALMERKTIMQHRPPHPSRK